VIQAEIGTKYEGRNQQSARHHCKMLRTSKNDQRHNPEEDEQDTSRALESKLASAIE